MPLPNDIVFTCLALSGPDFHGDPFEIEPGLSVRPSPPVELDNVWQTWLGTIQTRAFRESGLVITSQTPVRLADEIGYAAEETEKNVRLAHYCLLLQGCAYTDGALMVGGNTLGGVFHLGPISPWLPLL
jgi:hypothetical protein